MKKILAILLVVALMVGTVAACAAPTPEPAPAPAPEPAAPAPEPAPEPEEEQTFRVAIQLLPPPNQFHAHMRILIEEAVAAAPSNFEFQIFGSTDENDQVVVLETLFEQRDEWDGLIISPQNGTLVGPIAAQFYEAGIPVVIINRLTDPEIFTAYVAGDNPGGGVMWAHYIGEFLGEEGGTVFCSRMTAGTPIDRDRHYPFIETLETYYPQIEYIGSSEGGNSFEMGYDIAMAAMMAHDEITILYGHDEFAARGFVNAMIDAGRTDLKLAGFWGGTQALWDELDADRDLILRGIAYQPAMGTLAVETMIRILNGEDVPNRVVEPTMIFGPENLSEWAALAY